MEILEMAKNLGEAIKIDSRTIRYQKAKELYDNDKNLVGLVKEYNVQKMAMNEQLKSESKDDAIVDAIQRRIEELYGEIINSPVMEEYSASEKILNEFLNLVNSTITSAISGEDMGCTEEKCKTCGHCHN